MCAPSAPPPPDYAGAAVAQGQANKDAAIAGAQLSNPNVSNAYGTRKVEYRSDPVTGNPVPFITESFTPGQQQIFDNEQALKQRLGTLGLGAADLAGSTLSQKLDFNAMLGPQAKGRQEVIDAMMGRFDTDLGRRQSGIEADLVARGIPRGSEAWNREMERLDRGRNDALQQATIAADQKAMDERRQAITELLAERQIPLNEISAFRTGSQIQPLQFQAYTGQNVAAAPVFAATQAAGTAAQQQYQNDVAANNAMMSGMFSLGSAALGAPVGAGGKPWWMP